DLVVHVFCQRRIGHGAAVRHDGVRGLGKEEGRCALVLSHFTNMFDVVTPDAPDTSYRKYLVGLRDCDGGLRRGRDDVATVAHDEKAVGYLFVVEGCPGCGRRPGKDGCAYQVQCAAVNRAALMTRPR